MKLTGLVRPQDVSPQNVVLSSRIAGASISYNGNTMAAKRGLLGRILAIIWP
jgi:flagellar basal body L-ring protein FlgH